MALRIAQRLPRLAVVGVVLLLASATLAVGAAKRMTAVPEGPPPPVAAATLVVPDLSGQAFVFAKGTLEDNGFAWQVLGSSRIPLSDMITIDYLYRTNWSLWLDLKILLRTVPHVLNRRGL